MKGLNMSYLVAAIQVLTLTSMKTSLLKRLVKIYPNVSILSMKLILQRF